MQTLIGFIALWLILAWAVGLALGKWIQRNGL